MQENLFLWVQSGELFMVLKFGFIMITGYMETYNGQILLPISTLLKDAIVSVLLIQIQDGGTRLFLI